MRPGSDVVTFKKPGIVADRLHSVTGVAASQGDVETCSFQPLGVKDDVSNTAFASATHRCIAPPDPLAVNIKAEDQLIFQGQSYRVRGKKVYRDRNKRIHHVTVFAEEEHG